MGGAAAAGGKAGSAGAPTGPGGGGGSNADADAVRSDGDVSERGGDTSSSPGGAEAGGDRIGRGESTPVNPEYNGAGALVRPLGWEEWVFLGSALNLGYSTGAPPTRDILSVVYMEPTAYRYFKATGEFREGTMTALATYRAGAAGPPAERGIVPTAPSGFEMSVKD